MAKILLVEDDKSFGYVLSEYIKLKNFDVIWRETSDEAITDITKTTFDLVILDLNLRQSSGFDIAIKLKEVAPTTPFIFLTARDLKIDQLKGYKLGAEEYITKPIDEEILLAKISAIINRKIEPGPKSKIIFWKDLSLNIDKRELKIKDDVFTLTEKENLLMNELLRNPNKLIKRKEVLLKFWDEQDEFSKNSMDVYISRLRKLLNNSGISIRNVHGKGFILE
ncbi:response regulator transcription factor [Winogradskyella sp. R77965]|uniref:response regulator transcription factor n=1 Tax=Winogradskyella sp. R77965 TaxID=3093872 RepID=UPI0037DCE6D6